MKNFGTLIVLFVILYTIYQSKSSLLGELGHTDKSKSSQSDSVIEKKTEKDKKTEQVTSEKPTALGEDYPYKPSNVVERMLTNALSDFIKTPTGMEMAKTMLVPTDLDLKNSEVAFSTNGFSGIKRKYEVENIAPTTNEPAVCGQKIRLQYLIIDNKGKEVESNVIEYVIGNHKIDELNIIPAGMHLKEVVSARFFTLDKSESNPAKKGNRINLSVLEHITKNNFDFANIKIFDDYITTTRPVVCGDKIGVHYKISNIDGSLIKENDLKFIVGDYSYPEVLSYMVDKMPLLGARTVLLPEKYLSSNGVNSLIKSDRNQRVIVEFSKAIVYPKNDPVAK